MKHGRGRIYLMSVVLAGLALASTAAAQQAQQLMTKVKVGDLAPDFTLPDQNNKPVQLSDFRGKKNVVLAFYVLAFTAGWTKELKAYQADIAHYDANNVQILGISVDASPSNRRFAEDLGVTFPLLSDFKRTVSEQYGILDSAKSLAVRTSFVVDKQGVVQHIEQGSEAIDPSGVGQACDLLEHKAATQK